MSVWLSQLQELSFKRAHRVRVRSCMKIPQFLSLLLLCPTGFAALQSEQLISKPFQIHKNCFIKEVFESDYTCTENSISSESQIDKYYESKPNQLEALLRQTVEACSHR